MRVFPLVRLHATCFSLPSVWNVSFVFVHIPPGTRRTYRVFFSPPSKPLHLISILVLCRANVHPPERSRKCKRALVMKSVHSCDLTTKEVWIPPRTIENVFGSCGGCCLLFYFADERREARVCSVVAGRLSANAVVDCCMFQV